MSSRLRFILHDEHLGETFTNPKHVLNRLEVYFGGVAPPRLSALERVKYVYALISIKYKKGLKLVVAREARSTRWSKSLANTRRGKIKKSQGQPPYPLATQQAAPNLNKKPNALKVGIWA